MSDKYQDNRPDPATWEEEFGDLKVDSEEVAEKFAKESLIVLMNALKGRRTGEHQRKAAEFYAGRKVWPSVTSHSGPVNINVLRLEDLEAAKIKAGLLTKSTLPGLMDKKSDDQIHDSTAPQNPGDDKKKGE